MNYVVNVCDLFFFFALQGLGKLNIEKYAGVVRKNILVIILLKVLI